MIFFRRRKTEEDKRQSSVKECDHEWVEVGVVEYDMDYCELCGKLLIDAVKVKCKKCGKTDVRYKRLEELHSILYLKVKKPGCYPSDYYYVRLCSKCYTRFQSFIDELKRKLEEQYKVIDFESAEYEPHIMRNIDQLFDLLRELVYYGSPFKHGYIVKGNKEFYGLASYIVLKHLGKTLKIIIPYDVIVSYMKTKTNKGESRNDLREEKP